VLVKATRVLVAAVRVSKRALEIVVEAARVLAKALRASGINERPSPGLDSESAYTEIV
jgi:hypothetical protein